MRIGEDGFTEVGCITRIVLFGETIYGEKQQ